MLTKKEEDEYLKLLEWENTERIKADYRSYSEEYLWITNKQGERVKLIQNAAQIQLDNVIKKLRSEGKPPRVIILKARQEGISTDTEGRMIYDTTTKENRNGLVVAHRSDSTSALFAKTKYFTDNLTEDVQPLTKASNATELIFSEPTHYKGNKSGLNGKNKGSNCW